MVNIDLLSKAVNFSKKIFHNKKEKGMITKEKKKMRTFMVKRTLLPL